MQLGLIGLGKMGGNMRERLRRPATRWSATTSTLRFRTSSPSPSWSRSSPGRGSCGRWCRPGRSPGHRGQARRPARARRPGHRRRQLAFTDDFENEKLLKAKGIGYLDCGVSGGIWGLENGYGLMVGGTKPMSRGPCRSSTRCVPRAARRGFRARRQGRCGALHEDGAQRHRVRPDGRLCRGLRVARPEGHRRGRPRVPSRPGPVAPSCGPGCSTSWSRRWRRTPPWRT
jgi:hypothetical protein